MPPPTPRRLSPDADIPARFTNGVLPPFALPTKAKLRADQPTEGIMLEVGHLCRARSAFVRYFRKAVLVVVLSSVGSADPTYPTSLREIAQARGTEDAQGSESVLAFCLAQNQQCGSIPMGAGGQEVSMGDTLRRTKNHAKHGKNVLFAGSSERAGFEPARQA